MAVHHVALLVAMLAAVAQAQPFTFTEPQFQPFVQEAAQRNESQYEGFTFNFSTASPGNDLTPNGMIILNQVSQNPFVSTLPRDGNGQSMITLGPCASNTPHVHPRGSEISFLLYGGPIEFGMIEENAGRNNLVIETISQNTTIHIPQGLLHFSFNPTCQPTAFLANFGDKDPGTQSMWNSMMRVPTHILNAANGIPEAIINRLKQYPLVTAPGTGGEECIARCSQQVPGLSFATANKLTPLTPAEIV